jgi:hypothetical protein
MAGDWFSRFLPCCLFGDGVGVEPGLVLIVPDWFPACGDLWRRWALDGSCKVSHDSVQCSAVRRRCIRLWS